MTGITLALPPFLTPQPPVRHTKQQLKDGIMAVVPQAGNLPPLSEASLPDVHVALTKAYARQPEFLTGKSTDATAQLANPTKVALTNSHVTGGLLTLALTALTGNPVTALLLSSAIASVVAPLSYLEQQMINQNVLADIAKADASKNASGKPNLGDIGGAPSVFELGKGALDAVVDYAQDRWTYWEKLGDSLFKKVAEETSKSVFKPLGNVPSSIIVALTPKKSVSASGGNQ
jgi:hypothetical protein